MNNFFLKREYIQYKHHIEPKDNFVVHFVTKYPDWNWDWDMLSDNPNITLSFIENNIDKPWNWAKLSRNPNLTIEFVIKHINKKWDIYNLSKNQNIERIEHPLLKWRYLGIMANPTTSLETIEQYIKTYSIEWTEEWLFTNPNITETFLEKHINKIPQWLSLARNKNISVDFVKKHNNRHWVWVELSKNIPITCIENNPDLPWDIFGLAQNETLTIDFIKTHNNYNWCWYMISKNPAIIIEDIENNPDLPWDWKGVTLNPNITREFLKNYLDKSFLVSDLVQNIGLHCDVTFQRSIRKDIEERRNKICDMIDLPVDIKTYVLRNYIGYN